MKTSKHEHSKFKVVLASGWGRFRGVSILVEAISYVCGVWRAATGHQGDEGVSEIFDRICRMNRTEKLNS